MREAAGLAGRRVALAAAARAAASPPGPVAIGQRVDWPGVTLLDGRRLVAADLRDRAVVLVLFSIDCPYCHRHNRRIDRLAREVRARSLPLTVLAAAYDRDATAVAAHVAREELALPVTLEAQALRQWLNARRVMPMTCVIDRESVLRVAPRCPNFGFGPGSCGGCTMQRRRKCTRTSMSRTAQHGTLCQKAALASGHHTATLDARQTVNAP